MSLRAGLLTLLIAGGNVVAQQQQQQQPEPGPQPAAVDLTAAPASSPTIPPWTAKVEPEPPRVHDDARVHDDGKATRRATRTVTRFTRQLDLVERDPDAVVQVEGTMVVRGASSSSSSPSSSTSSSSSSNSTPSPLPSPFDNAPASIFKSPSSTNDACPTFMKNLLDDSTFKQCYPISMMLRTSTSFFEAEKQLVSIVRVLDATCAPDAAQCESFLTQAAKNLLDGANCKKEYDAGQVQVTEALDGLRAYRVLRAATCLQDPATQNYCFASAVTNVTNPSDIFLYSMPLGLPLPGASTPSCGVCTSQTMAVFHAATSDRAQQITGTYRDAARQVNTICGPGFVNDTATSAAGRAVAAAGDATTMFAVAFATLLSLAVLTW
ncbi:hypothetical protein MY11210_002433 [Beauveria gryllotalpidicola]